MHDWISEGLDSIFWFPLFLIHVGYQIYIVHYELKLCVLKFMYLAILLTSIAIPVIAFHVFTVFVICLCSLALCRGGRYYILSILNFHVSYSVTYTNESKMNTLIVDHVASCGKFIITNFQMHLQHTQYSYWYQEILVYFAKILGTCTHVEFLSIAHL